MSYVYALLDHRTDEIRYVGRAADLVKRYREHHMPSKLATITHKNNWVRSLLLDGLKARLVVLEETSDPVGAERWWIHHLRGEGCDLTNATVGGDGPHVGYRRDFVVSEASRRKISESLTGRKQDPAAVAKRQAANKGQRRTAEFKEQARWGIRAKLTPLDVEAIKCAVVEGVPRIELALAYDVHIGTISKVARGVTYSSDSSTPHHRKLRLDQVELIRVLHEEGLSHGEIARRLDVHPGTVSKVVRGRTHVADTSAC